MKRRIALTPRVSVEAICDFNVYRTESEASEHHAVSLDRTPAPFDTKRSEEVDPGVRERRFVWQEAIFEQTCHLLFSNFSIDPAACCALADYLSDRRVGLWDPALAFKSAKT